MGSKDGQTQSTETWTFGLQFLCLNHPLMPQPELKKRPNRRVMFNRCLRNKNNNCGNLAHWRSRLWRSIPCLPPLLSTIPVFCPEFRILRKMADRGEPVKLPLHCPISSRLLDVSSGKGESRNGAGIGAMPSEIQRQGSLGAVPSEIQRQGSRHRCRALGDPEAGQTPNRAQVCACLGELLS